MPPSAFSWFLSETTERFLRIFSSTDSVHFAIRGTFENFESIFLKRHLSYWKILFEDNRIGTTPRNKDCFENRLSEGGEIPWTRACSNLVCIPYIQVSLPLAVPITRTISIFLFYLSCSFAAYKYQPIFCFTARI